MKIILHVLKQVGEVARLTMRPAAEECGGNLSCPPIITWRYKEPTNEIATFFRRVVGTFQGTIAWEFSAIERTWCLMPSRIREYSKAHGNLGGRAVAEELMTLEPDFGKQANAELWLLITHIQNHIENAIKEEQEEEKRRISKSID